MRYCGVSLGALSIKEEMKNHLTRNKMDYLFASVAVGLIILGSYIASDSRDSNVSPAPLEFKVNSK